MNIPTIIIAAVLGAVGGVTGSHLMLNHKVSALEAQVTQIPPLAVVDFAKIAMEYPEGATTEEMEALMVKTNEAVIKLYEAGYMVLDAAAVVSAPDELYLPEDLIQ